MYKTTTRPAQTTKRETISQFIIKHHGNTIISFIKQDTQREYLDLFANVNRTK